MIFENHYAAGFPTMPARADFFTGKFSFTSFGWEPLPKDEIVLAQYLSDSGYHTAGIVDTPYYIRKEMNYDRGFQCFLCIPGQAYSHREFDLIRSAWRAHYETDRFAAVTIQTAANWLVQNVDKDFFLFIDTWDPHEPWDPPDWYIKLYEPNYDGTGHKGPVYGYYQDFGLTENDIKRALACYAGEISLVDRWIGYFLEILDFMNKMKDTIIIFTSDHGFYFGEKGGLFGKMLLAKKPDGSIDKNSWDKTPLYDEITHVPLMIYSPKYSGGRTKALTSAIDIMPTILELTGVAVSRDIHGHSLVPILKNSKATGREFVVTSAPLCNRGDTTRVVDDRNRTFVNIQMTTITNTQWSLLYSTAKEPKMLFNLINDPSQNNNVIDKNREEAERLHKQYFNMLKKCNVKETLLESRRCLDG
jgi:arylsulfatase A-like enzyme